MSRLPWRPDGRSDAAPPGGEHRVVIVGGGFAGLFAARALGRAGMRLTLVDPFPAGRPHLPRG